MTAPTDPQAELFAALAKAQAEFPPIARDKTVVVKTKTGGSYTFNYAPLDSILAAVRPKLAENGLAVTQALDTDGEGRPTLVTRLVHAGGGSIGGRFPLKTDGMSPQELGGLITYMRRYAVVAVLGIASEEDDDANHASGNTATAARKQNGAAAKASKEQVDEIETLIAALNLAGPLTEPQIRDGMLKAYGTEVSAELSRAQAGEFVKRLAAKTEGVAA